MAKAKVFHFYPSLLLVLVMIFLSIYDSEQLKSSEFDTLLRIQRDLNFPSALSSWNKHTDFCDSNSSSSSSTVVCYEDTITQLHIIGETKSPLLLPQNFSINSFITTLSSLPNLKVLTLVSLGMWGPLPSNISHLSSLEILNMSSNYLFGTIPQELSSLSNLQTLILDGNMFSGVIPYWIDSFPALAVLSLRDNRFNGSLPDSLGSLKNLRILSLSNNHFHGEVPDLSSLRNLQVLELDGNGFGPRFPRLGTKLVSIVLRNNSFRSGIPSELISYYQLERLDMSLNTFVGPFQPALLSLPSITYLNISGNKLTGMVFENLSCNSELKAVDLSSNLLTGRLPRCLLSNSSDRTVLYAGNCLDGADQNQNPPPLCHTEALAVGILPERKKQHRRLSNLVLSVGIVGGTIGGVALIALIFFVVKRGNDRSRMRNPPTRFISENAASGYTSKLLSDARYISQTMKLGAVGLPSYRTFSLEEIEAATSNFDTASFMGEGSHGQMYRGQLKNGSLVTIKCVKMRKGHSTQNFMQHIELISKLRHRNLASALGHCFECYLDDSSVSRIFLVFEYVPNGTLKSWISDDNPTKSLSWSQRIAAAIGVAKGIQFLHTGILPGVYSNNLRITDVLLDQNLVAKISSYNLPLLSKMGKVGHGNSSSKSKSPGANKSVKHEDKSDIYDFGVILLEVILGRTMPSKNDVDALKNLLQASIVADDDARKSVVDPAIRKGCLDQSLKTMMEICVRCLMKEAEDRPSIEDVLWNLQFAAQVQDAWRVDSQSSCSSEGSLASPLELPRLAFQ